MMVVVNLDSSAITVEATKNRSAEKLKLVYLVLLACLKKVGANSKKHVMDNEVSELLKENINKECKFKLVPPGCHRRNIAEVGIKSTKAHFIAILEGLPKFFPLRLCCQLLPQMELTLNTLQPVGRNPNNVEVE